MPRSKTAPQAPEVPPPRTCRTLRVDRLVGRVLGPAARRRGFTEAAILHDWASVIGDGLAARCQPVKVEFPRGRSRGGTLHLHARGGAVLELQHMAPQLIERINGYFGYPAIRRIHLLQAPPPPRPAPPPAPLVRPLSAGEEAELRAVVGGLVADPLGRALLALGRTIRGSRRVR
jgi:hypothetical protein